MTNLHEEELARALGQVRAHAITVSLREHVEALFNEKDRALTMAADEREKAASVLREEQHRSLTVAENEREKAASALREALARSISEGDERLREHIANQVAQIRASLESGELLEIERIRGATEGLNEKIESNTREFRQAQNAAQAAVQKAEEAQQRVNESQNEFRATLADQAATLMPRKEVEALMTEHIRQVSELREQIAVIRQAVAVGPSSIGSLQSRAARDDGRREGSEAITRAIYSVAALLIGIGGFILALLTR